MDEMGRQFSALNASNRKSEEKTATIREIYDYVGSIVFAITLVILIGTFTFRQAAVTGVSMENTFNAGVTSENVSIDRVLVSDINYTNPKRGDIVVLYAPELHETLIKRVIGVGGDVVDINFTKHTVSVNHEVLKEPYIKEPTSLQGNVRFPITVPKGHVFVMGDNRNDSYDSRFSAVGIINNQNIAGKVFLQIYPFNQIKWFNSPF